MPASLAHQRRMLSHLERQQVALSPLDIAWERINALGGYVAPGDVAGKAANDTVGEALKIIEDLGGRDPAQVRAGATP